MQESDRGERRKGRHPPDSEQIGTEENKDGTGRTEQCDGGGERRGAILTSDITRMEVTSSFVFSQSGRAGGMYMEKSQKKGEKQKGSTQGTDRNREK